MTAVEPMWSIRVGRHVEAPATGVKGLAERVGTTVMGPLAMRVTRKQMERELSLIAQRAGHLAAGGG
ncbi:hypothetical protein [Micrococcus sp. FDAARGOS_333]|uniref:hypothetical protein n=1 Tax=Micrococcus sp. FDAARGOS_333 TaxID=1930558 RepID=UPI000B4E2CCA|nr:hypothetical protein [Micrococcus sp. FDAARGOS_333]PNL16851.1 hypothetical protein CEQ11_000510 [Micrococcus sp. FDAARGOS_333]